MERKVNNLRGTSYKMAHETSLQHTLLSLPRFNLSTTMALNSPKSLGTTLSPSSGSNPTIPNANHYGGEEVNSVGQLGLNQRVTKLRKTSLAAKKSASVHGGVNAIENVKAREIPRAQFSLDDGHNNTESVIRASQFVRAQLMHAASSNEAEAEKKARDMLLQAQLLCASTLASKNEVVVGGTSKPTSLEMLRAIAPSISHGLTFKPPQLETNRFLNHFDSQFSPPGPNSTDVDKGITTLCPPPLTTVYFGYGSGDNNTTTLQNVSNVGEPISNNNENDSNYDGRIHSYPYKKNGPYTCPKCKHVADTSQKFAAHVSSSHYKYETKSERKKRLMAKTRKRILRLERVSAGLTIVPDHAAGAFAAAGNNFNVAPPRVRMKVEHGVDLAVAPPPGMEKLPGVGGVKIKLEPLDA